MPDRLVPCHAPPAPELATLHPDRPVKVDGNWVQRFRDARGVVRYERVTGGYSEPRWFRVAAPPDAGRG